MPANSNFADFIGAAYSDLPCGCTPADIAAAFRDDYADPCGDCGFG